MSTPFGAGTRVAVVGGGRMGAGVAHAFLLAGAEVHLVDVSTEAAQGASTRVLEMLRRGDGGAAGTPAQLHARLSVGSRTADVAGSAIVVEAVPEDVDLKLRVLAEVEAAVGADAVLATNTSSISIDELATALERPQSFVGMHFFNPVPVSALVEVVVGSATSPATTALARAVTGAMGKTAVVVRDSPGFASSRLGVALGLEAIRMVEDGVASPEDVDAAMTLGYRHPVGPLRLTDLVGLDVRLGIADYLRERLGDRFRAPDLMREMVVRGELGRKAGQGFYRW